MYRRGRRVAQADRGLGGGSVGWMEGGIEGGIEGGREGGNEKRGRSRRRSINGELIGHRVQFWQLKAEGRASMYTYLGCVCDIGVNGRGCLLVLLPGLPEGEAGD